MQDLISRQAAIDAFPTELTKRERKNLLHTWSTVEVKYFVVDMLEKLPSAQPEQRYTEEELRVFQHGISLSLLSKRSAQHWYYDEDTATEIKFLERLYDKVSADMKGGQG